MIVIIIYIILKIDYMICSDVSARSLSRRSADERTNKSAPTAVAVEQDSSTPELLSSTTELPDSATDEMINDETTTQVPELFVSIVNKTNPIVHVLSVIGKTVKEKLQVGFGEHERTQISSGRSRRESLEIVQTTLHKIANKATASHAENSKEMIAVHRDTRLKQIISNLAVEADADDDSHSLGIDPSMVPLTSVRSLSSSGGLTARVFGLRVEEHVKGIEFDDGGVAKLLADTEAVLRIFGEGITTNLLVQFTASEPNDGGSCNEENSRVFNVSTGHTCHKLCSSRHTGSNCN